MSEPWPVSAEQHLHLARRFVAAAVEAEHDMRIVRHNTRVIRRRYAEARATADALAAKIETMLRDEEDARALRLAEHAAREDVAGKLAELQAAVRAHEADARASGHAVPQRDLDLWTAAKT